MQGIGGTYYFFTLSIKRHILMANMQVSRLQA